VEILIRATIVFWVLWVVARGLGKRELAEMSAFELILLVTVGDLVQQGVTQEDFSMTGALIAVGTLAFWILVLSMIGHWVPSTRRVLEGAPVVILRDGELADDILHLERIGRDDVEQAARAQGIRDLAAIDLGILEPDGRFSFLPRQGTPSQVAEAQRDHTD
jgi:uncharacterized membrane protein YcaP (DUF421 family)